ncbi:AraC family transcriptional regulator N-terminal domain-containing protein [Marinobacter nanhaiticus D15-8W]|uniref:AraC family transcriptional regulator n=1 Tax=Marinobacter nanhaiticus D15-8W TaxID=626887 RepID=N6WWK9_9GAMM|nr:AraC family transcriptional regulator [Marinobacter nanhaiticus]ENO15991.1 AraC family transcriptional regulator [Marinobacter nanhaiticus D15-8W]BES73150.1 AraC family transcriptional regulator N-terminal domain-containing protein [Marinobacter nanhaiticus D15-8W]
MTIQPNIVPVQPGPPSLNLLRDLVERQWLTYGPETGIDGLRLTRAPEPSGTIRALYQTSFCVVLQGAKVSAIGDSTFHYRRGECLFASVNVPVNSRIVEASPDQPYLALSLSIDPAMISELLLAHPEVTYRGPKPAALVTAGVPDDMYDPVIRLLRLLDQPQDRDVLEPLVRREICWRLLRSPLGPPLQEVGLKDSETARIGRVTAWIQANYQQPFRVADLAGMASMSPASFHRHFKTITQLTPVQFQKLVRLQEARRLLLSEQEVASVGYQVGYESASQFSRDYHRLFGAPPGRDKAVLRSSVAIESGV